MDDDVYNPVPHDHEEVRRRLFATEEGRRAYAEAQEEFALIDAMQEAVAKSGLTPEELARRMGTRPATVSRLLRGHPSWRAATRLIRAAGYSVDRIALKACPVSSN